MPHCSNFLDPAGADSGNPGGEELPFLIWGFSSVAAHSAEGVGGFLGLPCNMLDLEIIVKGLLKQLNDSWIINIGKVLIKETF